LLGFGAICIALHQALCRGGGVSDDHDSVTSQEKMTSALEEHEKHDVAPFLISDVCFPGCSSMHGRIRQHQTKSGVFLPTESLHHEPVTSSSACSPDEKCPHDLGTAWVETVCCVTWAATDLATRAAR
ncbi:unnamed protein product, partial [Amoebophrya sp. A120]